MRIVNHATTSDDIVTYLDYVPVGMSLHAQLIYTPGPPFLFSVPMGPFLEPLMNIGWPPGALAGKHKLTNNVLHRGFTIALEKHDVGNLIPHMPIPSNEALFVLHTLLSSRKVQFYAGEVLANGKGIAACTMFDIGVLPTPMVGCGAIPNPSFGTGSAVVCNSLLVGMTGTGYVAGLAELVVSMGIAFALSCLKPPGKYDGPLDAVGFITARVTDALKGALTGLLSGVATSGVGGFVRLTGQLFYGFEGSAGIEGSASFGPFSDGYSYERDADGTVRGQRTTSFKAELIGRESSETVTHLPTGGSQLETRETTSGGRYLGGVSGSRTHQSTYDRSGNLRSTDTVTTTSYPSGLGTQQTNTRHNRQSHPASSPHEGVPEL